MTPQAPIDSPFGYRSTAKEIVAGVDLSSKDVIVTGGYSGLGLETVRALAGDGANVIVAARRPEIAAAELEGIAGNIKILALDLSNPESIDGFVKEVQNQIQKLDILINNAAIMACDFALDARGFESQLATNHLGHFQMTQGLWPLLKAANGARVVVLSSSGHARNGLDLGDPHFQTRPYDKWTAYAQAKSANALFALSLDEIGKPHNIRAFAVDPGGIRTPLQRHLTMEEQIKMGWYDADGNLNPLFKTTEEGAATSVWCAVSPLLNGLGGVFCANCNIAAPYKEGDPMQIGVHPHVRDTKIADAWWKASEAMLGLNFT